MENKNQRVFLKLIPIPSRRKKKKKKSFSGKMGELWRKRS